MSADFKKGVWYAIEFLILNIREPGYARELIRSAKITRKDALEFVKQTDYQGKMILDALDNERTWN